MAPTTYLDHLAQIRLFASCSQRELQKIARASDEVTIDKGRVLMQQGQRGREAFVIIEGTAGVDIGGARITELGPGMSVGELALLDGGTRTATVTALTDMRALVLDQRAFTSLLDDVPGLARKILAKLAGIVRELDEQLVAQG